MGVSYTMPNRLAHETSPYLLQHAGNPVDWYPWGDEALACAQATDRPILLSIGYAACHWCHVMAHESFEDPATAALMNERFVNIKVDREERPDLDSIYMQAVQAMTGHGGWPMTVFLTPAGEPFFGGTYFPPDDRRGLPSFRRVLTAVADGFETRRDRVAESAAAVRRIYDAPAAASAAADGMSAAALDAAFSGIAARYDSRNGGLDGAPKFPPTMLLDFLLRHWARTGKEQALHMAHDTFLHMAGGGIYDQIGGGFARYSVDAEWRVPHFEKMLYDNALLIRLGAHLWQATHDDAVRRVTEDTIAWLGREMTSPEGGFHSSLDADSEGEEGRFYVWTGQELDGLLGADASIARMAWGVTDPGPFEGRNVLRVAASADEVAARRGISPALARAALVRARTTLLAARGRRVRPGRDDKILASWNALAARALLDAGHAFSSPATTSLGMRNATFLRGSMMRDGRVMRSYKDGVTRIPGFLEDQAATGLALLAAFEQSLYSQWLLDAMDVGRVMVEQFRDPGTGLFHDTARSAEPLITRPRDVTDNAIPSGTSLAVELLLRLADYTGDEETRAHATTVLGSLADAVQRFPTAFGHLLGDAEYALTRACHGEYCDMPSPAALDAAAAMLTSFSAPTVPSRPA